MVHTRFSHNDVVGNGRHMLFYKPKSLVAGARIQAGLTGLYAAVPNKGYKGNKFTILYTYNSINENGEPCVKYIEKNIDDWNRAEQFRKFMDKWGKGAYTLGYFKMCEKL